jgi:hypothetical protein
MYGLLFGPGARQRAMEHSLHRDSASLAHDRAPARTLHLRLQ